MRLPRPGPASLRLALAVAGAMIAVAMAAMVAQYRLTERTLSAREIALLQADLDAFAALYEQRRIPALREAIAFRADATEPRQIAYLLLDKRGAVLAGNLAGWPAGLAVPLAGGFDTGGLQEFSLSVDGATLPFQGVTRLLPGGFPLLVARGTAELQQTLAALRRLIWGVAAVLVLVALVAGVLVSGWVIGRIRRLNELADRVAGGDLAARLPGERAADEFGQLESHVHRMLDRIQGLNRATHRLSDSIAHELRTPLNRMAQKLDALRGHGDAVAEIRAEMRATVRIFDSLLDISAAEAQSGSSAGIVPVDLSTVASEVFELYEAAGEEKGLRMQSRITPDLWVLGDRNLIAQLLSNLFDNAIKFTPAGGTVRLELAAQSGRSVMVVSDTGPGLPESMREAVFDRFVRVDGGASIAGHGLGLALVSAIATRHGARVSLDDARPGLVVRTVWPRFDPTAVER